MLETTSGFQVQEPFSETHTLSAPPTSDPTRRRSRLRSDSGSWQAESNGNRLGASYVMNDILAAFDFDAFLTEPPQVIRAETLSSQEDMPPLSRVSRTALPLPTESTYHDNIAVSCDPPTDDEEDQSSESVLDDRRRRNHALDTESENDTDEIRHPLSHKYVRQWPHPRPIQWLGKASSISTTEPKPPGPDVPYKRFFIEQRKHVVSIKFDPPV